MTWIQSYTEAKVAKLEAQVPPLNLVAEVRESATINAENHLDAIDCAQENHTAPPDLESSIAEGWTDVIECYGLSDSEQSRLKPIYVARFTREVLRGQS